MESSGDRILVAIPDDWRDEVSGFVEQLGLAVVNASTHAEALKIAQTQALRGIITVGEWVIADKDNHLPGLIENSDGKTPSVMLVRQNVFNRFFDWYNTHYSPLEEYCHIPFDREQLRGWMKRVGMIKSLSEHTVT